MPQFESPFSGLANDRKLMDEELVRAIRCYRGENPGVLTNPARMLNRGRLASTGRMIILPVDQDLGM